MWNRAGKGSGWEVAGKSWLSVNQNDSHSAECDNTPAASLSPHLPGLLTEAAHLRADEPVFQSGRLSLGPPAAWNSTEDIHQRNYTSYTPEGFTGFPLFQPTLQRWAHGTDRKQFSNPQL